MTTLRADPCQPVATTPTGRRILDAASRLFFESGIAATGVDRIVEEAGTTKRTLYQRFGSKDALVAAYLQQRAHEWQRELLDRLPRGRPHAGLDGVYDQAVAWAGRAPRGCAFVNAWSEISASNHEARTIIEFEKAWMRGLFAAIAGGGEREGGVLHLLYEGAQVTASITGEPGPFELARSASHRILDDIGRIRPTAGEASEA